MEREFKYKEHTLVVVGNFNPAIFQPWWFAANGIIGDSEAKAAAGDLKVVHPTASRFSLGLLDFQITTTRMAVTSSDEGRWEYVRDLVMNTFRKMPHDPVSAVGINMLAHFTVADEEDMHRIGHELVPKEPVWTGVLKTPLTKTVMVQGDHLDGSPGQTNVRIEGSALYKPGIFVDINDHHPIEGTPENPGNGQALVGVLDKIWKSSMEGSKGIMSKLKADL